MRNNFGLKLFFGDCPGKDRWSPGKNFDIDIGWTFIRCIRQGNPVLMWLFLLDLCDAQIRNGYHGISFAKSQTGIEGDPLRQVMVHKGHPVIPDFQHRRHWKPDRKGSALSSAFQPCPGWPGITRLNDSLFRWFCLCCFWIWFQKSTGSEVEIPSEADLVAV